MATTPATELDRVASEIRDELIHYLSPFGWLVELLVDCDFSSPPFVGKTAVFNLSLMISQPGHRFYGKHVGLRQRIMDWELARGMYPPERLERLPLYWAQQAIYETLKMMEPQLPPAPPPPDCRPAEMIPEDYYVR